ncbi:MAG TPA: PIN domain-containing protein [Terracidiphilus sp.]|jgi:predicted nucleic acid-binding protein|nr:PIN domain-containing protein [Terracidiphilus sp.]
MAFSPRIFVDTNILLRISQQGDPQHRLIKASLDELNGQGIELCFALQNIAEFWNVCTRPKDRNGYGLTIMETDQRVAAIERTMTFLPDIEQVYSIWRESVVTNNVRGVQVHDARLAAVMRAFGVTRILTLNQSDFLRYAGIQAVHPNQVQSSPR